MWYCHLVAALDLCEVQQIASLQVTLWKILVGVPKTSTYPNRYKSASSSSHRGCHMAHIEYARGTCGLC